MANQITDGRTSITTADATTGFTDLAGGAAGTLDTEIFIQGTGSIGQYITTTRTGLLYNTGAAQNWTGNTFYIWINSGIVGLLSTKAAGGLTIRFCGTTVTNWFEVYVAGSDDWPNAVRGGWTQFVVNIDTARSAAVTNGWTNGTTPATSAIQYVGYSAITAATMPRMVDNTWIDQIARLPSATPGIIVEGRNAGTTDWSFSDMVTQLGVAAGTAKSGPGGSIVLNAPVQIGINDTTTHGFTDTNATVLWENAEYVPDGFYGISALGNAGGTTNFTMGIKSGTGDAATGAQGGSITSATNGPRWFLDFDDANLDAIGFYGVSMAHGQDFQWDSTAVEVVSCIINDVSSATVSNSLQLKNTIVDANTADGVAFMTTDDLGDIRFCEFQFSDGHAIQLTTPRIENQTSTGNAFSGYGATGTNDAAIYNNTGGLVNISIVSGGSVSEHTYRNGTGASTTATANISVTFTGIADGTEVRVYVVSSGLEEDGVENSTGGQFVSTLQAGVAYNIVAIQQGYVPIRIQNQTYTADATVNLGQQIDRNFQNP